MTAVTSVREAGVYHQGGRDSFFRDLALSALPGYEGHAEAMDRLNRHRQGTKDEKRAIAQQATARRAAQETRAGMTTASASGGSFVTPIYAASDFIIGRNPIASFAPQCAKVPDPGYGMILYVPAVTSSSTAAAQASETAGVSDSTPTGTYQSQTLVAEVGEIEVSQQLLDRADPSSSVDLVLSKQLGDAVCGAVDAKLIAQAIAAAGTGVTNAATGSTAGQFGESLWSDLAKASYLMMTASGQAIMPTHVFANSIQVQYAFSQTDAQLRPLLTPRPQSAYSAVQTVTDDNGNIVPAPGDTGTRIGLLDVLADDNIPTTASHAQLLVTRPSELFALVSECAFRVFPDTSVAGSLSVVVQAYAYCGVVARYSGATQVITGARYPAVPTFPQV